MEGSDPFKKRGNTAGTTVKITKNITQKTKEMSKRTPPKKIAHQYM
jgi:hypothetical protein